MQWLVPKVKSSYKGNAGPERPTLPQHHISNPLFLYSASHVTHLRREARCNGFFPKVKSSHESSAEPERICAAPTSYRKPHFCKWCQPCNIYTQRERCNDLPESKILRGQRKILNGYTLAPHHNLPLHNIQPRPRTGANLRIPTNKTADGHKTRAEGNPPSAKGI